MTTNTNWPAGWTARERVETVTLDRRTTDAELAEDYSDTRWADD